MIKTGPERRRFGRRETSIEAQAIPTGRAGVRCTIKNISAGGALIVFAKPFKNRGPFRLLTDDNKLDAQCLVRHQDETGAGVEFISVTVNKLAPPIGAEPETALYQAPPKPALVAATGIELRQQLFGNADPEPAAERTSQSDG